MEPHRAGIIQPDQPQLGGRPASDMGDHSGFHSWHQDQSWPRGDSYPSTGRLSNRSQDYRRADGRAQPRAPRRLPDLELYDSTADSGFPLSDDSGNLISNAP